MSADLQQRLIELRTRLVVPREEDGTEASLVALMPCEPAIGEVAVACWSDSDGGELVELVRIDDASRVDDQVALREALTLLAMVETVEELASFDELDEIASDLSAWTPLAGVEAGALADAREEAVASLDSLAAIAPSEVRMARTQRLDELGAALRELEQRWTALEAVAERWSDALLEARGATDETRDCVQELWRALGAARRGPLARPVSTALHEGREAGVSMAAAVAGD